VTQLTYFTSPRLQETERRRQERKEGKGGDKARCGASGGGSRSPELETTIDERGGRERESD
jgi:hypothetical protein